MKAIKPLKEKKSAKQRREFQVLIGAVEHYLKTGKPVGSNTLKETEFQKISSATIRNYFSHLEKEGYLTQPHASGGRIPTPKAYRIYAEEASCEPEFLEEAREQFGIIKQSTTQEIASLLERAADTLSSVTQTATFLSAPRFDHDFILDIKVVAIDANRCLCVLISNFGVIRTEVLHSETKLSAFAVKRFESYFHWRLTGHDKPENMEADEETLAQKFYNEVIVRYVVGYVHFKEQEIYRTGFSQLLSYSEFDSAQNVAHGLGLFENRHGMQLLLTECTKKNQLMWWVGDDLHPYAPGHANCTVIAHPYYVGQTAVGAVAMLGPIRMPYRQLFGTIMQFASDISEVLTQNLYKYQITYRKPQEGAYLLEQQEGHTSPLELLEDKRNHD